MDLDRLPVRNLGRDDRIISYWGKEVRYPFLAGHVIDFIARTPVWMKMDYRFEEGVGDKMLLRLLAKRLGLEVASSEKKRAIHFGEFVGDANAELGDRPLTAPSSCSQLCHSTISSSLFISPTSPLASSNSRPDLARSIVSGARTAKMELGSGRDKGEMMLE